jgi:membrane protease YdiL (CAAX protease family)
VLALCRRQPVACFVVLAYALSWAWWLPFVLRGDDVTRGDPWPTQMVGLLGPGLAAVLVTAALNGRGGLAELWSRITRWRVPARWFAVSAGTLVLGLGVATLAHPGRPFSDAASYSGTPNLGLVLTFLLVLVVNGFGEETGWRGFLADRLLPRHGPLKASLLVTAVWGLWHLPLFFLMPSFRGLGIAVLGWIVGLACGSLVLTWMYAHSGRSVLVAALWHTCFNFASGTALADGAAAAVTSTVVMVAAGLLAVRLHAGSARRRLVVEEST